MYMPNINILCVSSIPSIERFDTILIIQVINRVRIAKIFVSKIYYDILF